MEIMAFLMGVSLLVAGLFLYFFIKSVRSGQFEDDYTPSVRVLFDDQPTENNDKPS